ncbi:DUF2190 family protein [Crateriforma conspicua]|uniref:DUF2190 family protein n=1 Tax=Crateriforma conspicua TaxID=2527996 RepID=A0A5C5XQY7_9PLAN|nr:DUF2190 family protein [Crateriforma conspicua]TWT65617.1 hypothetical protein Pan14r_51640 [Crateriforma conspicua]
MSATFKHGRPLMIDHTPGSDVTAGDVVELAACVRIAHSDIPSGQLGALASGGGVYEVDKVSAQAWADGESIYWDDSAELFTTVSTDNTLAGKAAAAAANPSDTGLLQHIV